MNSKLRQLMCSTVFISAMMITLGMITIPETTSIMRTITNIITLRG